MKDVKGERFKELPAKGMPKDKLVTIFLGQLTD